MKQRSSAIDRRRYRRITGFFARTILRLVLWDLVLGRVMPGRVRRTRPERLQRIACRFRDLAVEMGGVMIKVGQFLSSRVDVLPAVVTSELAGLQDEVPAEPYSAICQVIEQELGQPPEELFARFERQPQAAASLGQTHRAWLQREDGWQAVVVKVQRLNIEQLVETDLAALRMVARWVMFYPAVRRRADVPSLVAEFARTTWEEIDYIAEAGNAERFKTMFADDPGVYIPDVFHETSTRRVLTLENVESIKITDFAGIEAAGVARSEVALKLMNVYLRQVFEEGFFHADPHPGNLFIRPQNSTGEGARPFQLVFVDFGMVGRVPDLMGDPLREIVVALTLQDAGRLVQAFRDLDFFLPGTDLDRVEAAAAQIMSRFWGFSMEELTQVDPAQVQDLAIEFRDLLFEMPFQVPQDFIFLGRAIGILSGLATSLDPNFDPWQPVERFGRQILKDQMRWPGWQEALRTLGNTVRPLIALPAQLESFLARSSRGDLHVRVSADRALQRQVQGMEATARRLYWGLGASALMLTGAILYVSDETVLGLAAWGVAGVSWVVSLISGRRR